MKLRWWSFFILMQCCFVFSYENSSDGNNKNSSPQVEISIGNHHSVSPKNSWYFSMNTREIPNNSNMQRADYSVVMHGSVELQNYFHQAILPLIYDATVHNHYCVIPGYVSPDGLRGCINQLSQFAGADALLVSDLTHRLQTYCNRIEDIVLRGKAYEFCDTLSQAQQTALLKVYADFLKEFYTNAASHIFYNHSQQNVLMQRIMPTINWDYYDGSTVKHSAKRLQQQRAASINGKLGAMYKALHEDDFAKAYNIGREQVTTVVGKGTEQTSVFEHYPALQQKIESEYKAHQLKIEQDRIAMQQSVATVQAECSNRILQKLHLDALQQRYDAAARTILNSESVQHIHKVTDLQATCFDTDHLTPDQKGILFTGNQLQHHLVDEAITVVDTVVCGDLNEKVGDAALGLVNTSVSLNKSGDVVMAARTLDVCWALVDFAKDAAHYSYSVLSTHVPLIAKGACDGVCESLHGAVHMVCHPVEAAQDVVNSFVVAGYCLGKLAYTSCVLEAANDLLEINFKQYEQIIQHYGIDPGALVAVYQHAKENVTTEDVARVGTKAVVDMMLLHGITKAVSALAQESLPTFISCMRKGGETAEVAMTAEGVPLRCNEEVASLMNGVEKAGAEVVAEVTVNSRNFIDGIVSNFMSEMKTEIETLKKLFDCRKNCVPDCVKRGFAEFKNHHIKIPYEHILGIELKWNDVKGILSGIRGFHHDFMGMVEKSGGFKFVKRAVEKNGCYLADIIVDGLTIRNKTFFPQHWSREKVISKIHEAYENFLKSGAIAQVAENGKYRIKAFTSEGIEIEMYFAKNGQMATAYPIVKTGI